MKISPKLTEINTSPPQKFFNGNLELSSTRGVTCHFCLFGRWLILGVGVGSEIAGCSGSASSVLWFSSVVSLFSAGLEISFKYL